MSYSIQPTSRFKKDLKAAAKRGWDLSQLVDVVDMLADGNNPLPEKYLDHALKGDWKGFRECHIQPDWLLIYKKEKAKLILVLTRTGSHADLFNE